ncbi:Fbox domain containing protein [Acanthamoeba castellanii str. Neff]|uniref:Fbox domain containing protein n=1 Tax=Acanthamoeba castellanii (strain ATCC 30010 / Neff) TaxID=1257118 RepID=L8GSF6_ACACF|nr:Fbox domain containing protein [Acanthamoeba castellanii str. Neff]ELR16094.1 Fbox domain containing protein [Acanthamoeba castellanii str. Neff]
MEKKQDVAEEDGRGEEEGEELLALHEVLPLEVMQHIMGMADPASVARAEGVCRAWRSACESPFVWEAVFRRHFSSRPSTTAKEKWRERCVKAAISLRRLQALKGEDRLRDTLRWCAACGHDRVLRELLTKEAAHMTLDLLNGKRPPNTDESKFQYSDDGSARPVHLAASVGCAEIMEVLMEKAGGPEKARELINAVESRTGNTALHFAAENGHCAMVAFLLNQGAEKNALNGSKQTALHLATLAGCAPAVRMLVEHGAQILFTAAEAKSKKVPASPLHLAASNRSEALVSLFIELGLDINLTDAAGRIPLHFAARAVPKNAGFIEFLLARGADAKAVDEEGQGVLHYAITNECSAELVAMCKRLIDAGADAHSKDPVLGLERLIARSYYQSSYDRDLVNLFVERGIDIKDPPKAHHYDLVLALLDWGVDPNASDPSVTGTTPNLPLHMALCGHSYHNSDADRRRVVELLLERGADVHRLAGYNQSQALFYLPCEPDETFDFLLSRGADINARNERGETFLYRAVNQNWPYNAPHFHRMRRAVVALIERGADPGQCRVDGHGPVSEVVDPTYTPLGWEWVAFLRSVGIPIRTAADDDEPAAAAAGSGDATGAEADDDGEGRAEPLGHHRLRNDGDDTNEDEEEEEAEEDSRSKGKEKLDK